VPDVELSVVNARPAGDLAGAPRVGPALGVVRPLATDDHSSPRVRVVDAALRCMSRQGTRKTTVDDIAREAGVSRATLYRIFPGGKEAVTHAVVETELARFFSGLAVVMGEAHDLEDVLVAGMVYAADHLSSHRALNYLLDHEPEVVLPYLTFSPMDRVLEAASSFTAPFFGRWLEPDQSSRAAEWAVRIVVSYLSCPGGTDLTDERDARRLVATFMVPGIMALAGTEAAPRPTSSKQTTDRPIPGGK